MNLRDTLRTLLAARRGAARTARSGFTSVETAVTLGIVGLLAAGGLASFDLRGLELTMAQRELQGCLHQAFVLARAQGRSVTLAPGSTGGPDIIPVRLPARVKWGKPAHIPLPRGMDDPVRADVSGEAHPRITISPRLTATASSWFFHDGREALCFRLSGRGRVTVLRYRAAQHRWERAS